MASKMEHSSILKTPWKFSRQEVPRGAQRKNKQGYEKDHTNREDQKDRKENEAAEF